MPITFRIRSRLFIALGLTSAVAITACDNSTPLEHITARQALRSSANNGDSAAVGRGQRTIAGQYIVVFRSDVQDPPSLAKNLVATHGGEIRFTYSAALRGFAASLPDAAVDAIAHNPNVELIESDAVLDTQGEESPVPSWGLDRIDQAKNRLDGKFDYAAPAGLGVHAYIIDSGIRSTHADFVGRIGTGVDFVGDGIGTEDCLGHGTHVSGTLGGAAYGVAKQVTIHPVRVFGCSGGTESSVVIAALDWVIANAQRPAVVNMSLGGDLDSALNTAVQNAVAHGLTVAVAAGNSSADACSYSPASASNALTVGASNIDDMQAAFSNGGPCVDLFAPGVRIQSDYFANDTSVLIMAGTSMAAPHVAGAAALYLSVNPTATPKQVSDALVAGATHGILTSLGAGSPNLLLYTGGIGAAVITAPSPTTDSPPTASFTAGCSKTVCRFDAGGSSDDHGIVSYVWTFGDGSAPVTSTTAVVTHTYSVPGAYTVVLTVSDGLGQTAKASRVVRPKKQ